jgi:hypothetical protein
MNRAGKNGKTKPVWYKSKDDVPHTRVLTPEGKQRRLDYRASWNQFMQTLLRDGAERRR